MTAAEDGRNSPRRSSEQDDPEISVALGTFNGQAYLAKQLASLAAQDRLPDELVVCDDASTDPTVSIIREFASRSPFPVRLEINDRNVGSTQNFGKAVGLCRGRLIFLADQDDVWLPQKIRRLSEALSADPAATFAFSDATRIDDHDRPLRGRLWETLAFSPREQRLFNADGGFAQLLRRNRATGMTMAFRARYLDVLLPVPAGWVHDGWFALLLAALGRGIAVAEPLVEYRQHAMQQIGAQPETLVDKYRRRKRQGPALYPSTVENYTAALQRLQPFADRLPDPSVLPALGRKIEHWQARVQMRSGRSWRLPTIVRELLCGSYGRYSSGWRSAAEDLLL